MLDSLEPRPNKPVILRCALPAPLPAALDYLAPDATCLDSLRPGVRVRVPLGRRSLTAVLIEVHQKAEVSADRLRPIDAILDDSPLLSSLELELLQWCARYYLHPPGEVLALGLSPRERRGEPPAPAGDPGVGLNLRGRGLPEGALARAPKQARLLALLQDRPHSIVELEQQGIKRSVVREMLRKDLIERVDTQGDATWLAAPPLPANSEQQQAIDGIVASLGQFASHLLDGITGSGKTEVYLQGVAECLARGLQVLVLIPEIGLTPQMVQRFRARFNAPLAVLHSGMADGERDRFWSQARTGQAAIVLGTRSAVFAPIAKLGLIIVDEEHDGSYRQQDGLRYSARDIAVKRAQLANCPVVLGSATPSLESLANVQRGRYQYHTLSQRAAGASTPDTHILDIRGLALDGGISAPLLQEVAATLDRGEQVLLFLNRRGFAPTLMCHDCGWVADCERCDAHYTLHRQPAALRCHHCDGRRPLPSRCPDCQGRRLVSTGLGTEQTEQVLTRRFANTSIHRVDSDSMSGRHAMANFSQRMETEGPCIIVGTQMLSKGHHFPGVTCVGVIDADGLLFNPDFRGEERLVQLLTQVGGRAGRAGGRSRVVIQTHNPDHPIIQAINHKPYRIIAEGLLLERQQRHLPPYGVINIIRCDSRNLADGMEFLRQLIMASRTNLADEAGAVAVVGPMPAAMARRAGLYRCQLLLHSASRARLAGLTEALTTLARTLKTPTGLRWFVDVDPTETA